MSYSPETGLVYFPVRDVDFVFSGVAAKDFNYNPLGWNTGEDPAFNPMPEDPATRKQIRDGVSAKLVAWDPVARREVWSVPMQTPWNGGTLSTMGGLVFQGNGEGYFVAYRATDGKELWSSGHLSSGIVAAPVSYSIEGTQYVSVAVGWGGIFPLILGELLSAGTGPAVNRVVTFKLDGNADLPDVAYARLPVDPPALTASAEEVDRGRTLYHVHCGMCHGNSAVNRGGVPDLRYSATLHDQDVFGLFPLKGGAEATGMPDFSQQLTEAEVESIRAYLIKRSNDLKDTADIP
jgi:mono/diheme cytochrome c family protein